MEDVEFEVLETKSMHRGESIKIIDIPMHPLAFNLESALDIHTHTQNVQFRS